MPVLFVARSARLARWGADVGFGKHLYRIGVSEDDPKALAAAGWAGETDWKKRALSKRSEARMPSVVITATTEQATSKPPVHPSTRLRARNSGVSRRNEIRNPPTASSVARASPP